MRVPLLALLVGISLPAASQSTVVSPLVGFSYYDAPLANGGGRSVGGGAYVGRTVGALEVGAVGVLFDVTNPGTTVQAAFGPRLTLSAPDGRTERRLTLGATASFGESARPGGASGLQALSLESQATVAREVRVLGVRVAPLAGAYGVVCASETEGLPGGGCAEVGALLGAEVRFRALGSEVSVPLVSRFDIAGNTFDAGNGNYSFHRGLGMQAVRFRF